MSSKKIKTEPNVKAEKLPEVDNKEVFEVEAILDKRFVSGKVFKLFLFGNNEFKSLQSQNEHSTAIE